MSAREFLARKTARALIEELAISSIPVDLMAILARKSLLFEESAECPPSVFGAVFRAGDTYGVIISTRCFTEGHRRFTIAHELGHYHLPDHMERLLPPGVLVAPSLAGHFRSRKNSLEVEADLFASELLMPEHLARPIVRSSAVGLPAIQALADACRTSLSSAAVRYAGLTEEPIGVLISIGGVIEWAARSNVLWEHQWARANWKQEWAPRGSATKQLADDQARAQAGAAASGSQLLCEWFADAPPNVEVHEDAVGLGAYGRVLTVLHAPDLPDADEAVDADEVEADDPPDWRDAMRPYRLG
jgi:hypothetical protein